jgi:predicted transcriptional regulator
MLKEKVNKFLEVGVSLKSIAAYSNIHYSTLSKWLNGVRELNEKNYQQVEIALASIVKTLVDIME